MNLSTEVMVDGESVEFPERCVGCGDPVGSGEVASLRGNPAGFYGVIPWIFGRTKIIEAPAHPRCGKKLARSIFLRNLSVLLLVVVAIILAFFAGLSKWQAIGVVCFAILGPIFWQVIRPLAFEFTHQGDIFKLMFNDREYAQEVASLNGGVIEDEDENSDGDDTGGG